MSVLVVAICILYVLAGYVCIRALKDKQTVASLPLSMSAGAAIALHAIWLWQELFFAGGQDLSIFNIASLIALLITTSTTVLARTFKLWFVLPVIYLFAILALLLANFIPSHYIIHLELRPQILIHISLALASFTVLMIAALYSLQLAYLDRSLKEHKARALHPALPSLMVIERQLFRLVSLGFVLLTLSLVSGYFFLGDLFASGKAHKAVFSVLAWLVYALLLWGHYQQGWRGRRVTTMSVSGALLLSLAYFGSRIVRELILGR